MPEREPLPWKREDFWYDVSKSVTSSVITAALLFTFAVVGGYIKAPQTRIITVVIGLNIAVFVASSVFSYKQERQNFTSNVRWAGSRGPEFFFAIGFTGLLLSFLGYG
jgi:hypothetical protein